MTNLILRSNNERPQGRDFVVVSKPMLIGDITMKQIIKAILQYYSEDAVRNRQTAAMNKFLSEATSLYHLEKLERDWFKNHRMI